MVGKRILILDNYDSFTDNLHHLVARIRPRWQFTLARNRDRSVFDTPWDGLIISPGPKGPADTGVLNEFLREVALPAGMPVFGVCLGMQFLAWYYGLTVTPCEDPRHGRTVEVEHRGEGLFSGLPSPFRAVRYNSLAVAESPEEIEATTPLKVTARQAGTGMIMGLTHRSRPLSAVQFHPESFLTEGADQMVENFFKAHFS